MPGMPSEFALMMLGPPSQPPSVTSYLDPATGQPKSYSVFVWNNHKRRNLLGSALTIAGAATGVSAAAGAIAVTQAATIALGVCKNDHVTSLSRKRCQRL